MAQPENIAGDLRDVIGRLIRRLRAERRDLTLAQVTVLGRLDRHGPSGISSMAAAEHVRPQSMASTIATLEAEGLVSRRPDAADGRRVVIDMTAAGREVLAADRRRREGWLAEAIRRDFTADERRLLADATKLLARLAGD
ncbi:MAG TPA: MarR family transcriptional regulator, partial [Gaiellales bacterium]|jgi:DNA-binding MarR family transcriptional regulator